MPALATIQRIDVLDGFRGRCQGTILAESVVQRTSTVEDWQRCRMQVEDGLDCIKKDVVRIPDSVALLV